MPDTVSVPVVRLGLKESIHNQTCGRDHNPWDEKQQPAFYGGIAGPSLIAHAALKM